MDTGWPISCISSRQVNDRLFNHPVHLSSNKSFIGMIRCPSSGSMVQLLRKPGRRESIPTPHPAPLPRKAALLMRRTIVLLATMSLTVLVASGVALAVTKIGTDGPDTLRGTNGDDNLIGKGGNDRLFALDGRDTLVGGPGKDVVADAPRGVWRTGDKILLGGPG